MYMPLATHKNNNNLQETTAEHTRTYWYTAINSITRISHVVQLYLKRT